MLTVDDIKKLTRVFATKEEVKELVSNDEFKSFKSEVLTRFDKLFGELKGIRQDLIFHKRQHERVEEEIAELKSPKR